MTKCSRPGVTRRTAAVVAGIIVVLAIGGLSFLLEGPNQCVPSATTTNVTSAEGHIVSAGQAAERAAGYLAANYNKGVGLIPETPGSCVFWLYSDNYLAATALLQYGHARGNAKLTSLATAILTTVGKHSAPLGVATNEYELLESAPCQVNSSHDYVLSTSHGVQIRATLDNGTGELSDLQYADVAFLKAVCLYQSGNPTPAMTEFAFGRAMFDGTGLRDMPFNKTGQYQAYKLALFVYASAVLGQQANTTALSVLLSMQANSGGFYTGYDADRSYAGTLTNTETTSLALLALTSYLAE